MIIIIVIIYIIILLYVSNDVDDGVQDWCCGTSPNLIIVLTRIFFVSSMFTLHVVDVFSSMSTLHVVDVFMFIFLHYILSYQLFVLFSNSNVSNSYLSHIILYCGSCICLEIFYY